MFRLMSVAVVAIATLFASADVHAGGGGAKKNSTIRVMNNFSASEVERIGVILNKSEAQLNNIASSSNPGMAFTNAGGKFIEAGKSASFSVQSGDHNVIIVNISNLDSVDVRLINVARGVTVDIKAKK